ncbi:hypothetical protein G647_06613 [Cladophialophora carrionii CBS 160.54]|uniref:DUF4267 domain-containing protein n=1 Tax=Cladophialophora carrionii CBS 160.54 TaxID=1279043 RepID=V9D8B0_9EURO|nr:uncharacterized protein G647_06613 [Cladophialophora carrionii CBS 160.54]ETI22538.1 hypothetical protein G647_06613 [Cladophialophora carrionii CBS 160.54]
MEAGSSIPPLQYLVAFLLPVMLIGVFVGSLVSPHNISAAALFPQPANKPVHSFFYLFATRELCLGVALLTLEAYNEWRAVTVLMACIGLNGIGDFLLAGASGGGWWPSFTTHGIPTIVGYWAVWKLWQEYW